MSSAIATLQGRLVADPEVRAHKNDRKWVTFRIAIDTFTREGEKSTDFWSCSYWGSEKEIDSFTKHMIKARPILVSGTPTMDTWESSEGPRTTLALKVDRWAFVDRDSTAVPNATEAPAPAASGSDTPF